MTTRNNQFSYGDYVWFVGVVEDVQDPEELGRVKVRINGYHSTDKNSVPTSALPWALVESSPFSANVKGVGITPHALIIGSVVKGHFLDGASAQMPIITGSYPSLTESEIDVNKLARGEVVKKTFENAGTWAEKQPNPAPKYPNNKVIETTSGHIIEIDDTQGKERLHVYHKSGTFVEFHTDGSYVSHVKGESHHIVHKDFKIYVKGNVHLNVDGNVTETIKGNKTSNITGNYKITCNSYLIETKASWTNKVGSSGMIKCGGTLTQKASKIFLN